ncbi:hypothetical protein HKBW3S25_00493 [Candidatus Hakubella thermalkaliphila]|uniref:Glycosyl transferase family 1 domain-containing protein n=1 Tax=Candidatus Hakubella thermalkaliphila TaxID=2754717 RepID=A0A6V8NYF6_9ACTN|nr:D-inositol 3-phosphate glycosyltransferase [Bacillota bacterium]GFP25043.1 hypothetical protein HKBW3S25_00493 [Candidatus Hakubella thermalkaliphila]GFP43065.1 hypothetical protein HKBW3C_02197 [Candidatus Hakubella thermalkaliphila]
MIRQGVIGVDYLSGLRIPGIFGRKRYEKQIQSRLTTVRLNQIGYSPLGILNLWRLNIYALRLDEFIFYPPWIALRQKYKIKHLAQQGLGYLLNLFRWEKAIVTIYDLVGYASVRGDPLLGRAVLSGLRKANRIVTISEYMKREIGKYLAYPPERIKVIYPGVDRETFKPFATEDEAEQFRKEREIPRLFVMYAGSEQDRKNVDAALRAFQRLKQRLPEVKFIKIGRPQQMGARRKTLGLIRELGLEEETLIIDDLTDQELAGYYNSASAFIFPSLEEGFGLPPLEAMACGCPVVTSNRASLPEVVGKAGIMLDPYDVQGFAETMHTVLTDERVRRDMKALGLCQAAKFSWDRSASSMEELYQEMSTD